MIVKIIVSILIVLCLVLEALFMKVERYGGFKRGCLLKGLASLCFIIIGIIAYTMYQKSIYFLFGLILGGIGDVLLGCRKVFPKVKRVFFVSGGLFFLAGHILYIIGLLGTYTITMTALAVGLLCALIIMVFLKFNLRLNFLYMVFGIIYIGTITMMSTIAIFNAANTPNIGNILFAVGSVFFVFSDVLLVIYNFGKKHLNYAFRIIKLVTYYIAQILIALSLFFI